MLALFATVTVLAAACGGGEEPAAVPATPQAPAAPVEPAADEVDPNGVLVYADFTGNNTLDPDREQTGGAQRQLYPVYDRLIHSDPDGVLVPGLATEWAFLDSLTFELTLRENVRFHDGATLDAAAVVANLNRSMTLEEASANVKAQAGFLDSVEALDARTVRINLQKANSALPFSLASNLGMMISPTALENSDLDQQPVGAGMFRVISFAPNDRTVYERFADYWDPESVLLQRLEIVTLADSQTRLNGVASGQITLTTIEASQVDRAESLELTVNLYNTLQTFALYSKLSSGTPMESLDFRRALQHAIDRQGIVDSIVFGAGTPTLQMLPGTSPGYNSAYEPEFYAYDPAVARSLVEQSGSSGRAISMLTLNRPEDLRMAEVIQANLAQAGIELELVIAEPVQVNLFTVDQCCDLFLGSFRGRDDAFETLQTVAGDSSRLRPGDVVIPGVAEGLTSVAAMDFGPQRFAAIRNLAGLIVEQAVLVPLYSRQIPYVDNGCVVGFRIQPNAIDEYRNTGVVAGCSG